VPFYIYYKKYKIIIYYKIKMSLTVKPTNKPIPAIVDYCKNPQNYKYLDKDTLTDFEKQCQYIKNFGKDLEKEDIGGNIAMGILNFGKGFITEDSLIFIAAIGGIKYNLPWAEKILGITLETAGKQIATETAESAIQKGATKVVAKIAMESTISSFLYRGLAKSAAAFIVTLNGILEIINPVGDILTILQIIGAIFDAWDPCDLKSAFGREQLSIINTFMNDGFRDSVLKSSINAVKDENNNIVFINIWPVEYFSDTILENYDSNYIRKLTMYQNFYKNNLIYNSEGELIFKEYINLPTEKDFITASLQIGKWISNDNIVVSNFFDKWYPLILGILVIFLIILYIM